MWKKISLGILIALFLFGSIAMIGWIGFQERIRLAVREFEQNKGGENKSIDELQETNQPTEDHTRIETKEDAEKVIKRLEGFTRTLEEDNLPIE